MSLYAEPSEKHLVAIIVEGKEYAVEPLVIQAKPGDSIYFQNFTDELVIVLFPKDIFSLESNKLEIGNKSYAKVTVSSVPSDSYPYTVFIDGYDDFASKDAAPKIIVYDDLE